MLPRPPLFDTLPARIATSITPEHVNQAPYLRQRPALEAYFFAIVVFIALISLASVTLLSLQSFTPLLVFGAAAFALVCSGLFLKRYGPSRTMSRPEWCVVALVVGAFALRANTGINVYGGQDPGVYTNVASYFAKHGTWVIKDQLLDELQDRPDLRKYYVATTLSRTVLVPNAGWVGVMVPGIYLSDMEKNEWVAQFYPVNTIWLAIGEWLFGTEWKGLPLALFSSLTLIAAYLLTVYVSSSPGAGLAAAFLLGTNAAHSYIGTSPVSEATAGLFFLSALAMLTSGFQYSSLLSFSALFLTRITGFITAPLILISLAWMVLKRKDRKAAWTGMGILISYGVSVLWGLTFSGPYSLDIYRSKLGLSAPLLQHAPTALGIAAILWISWCLLALRYHNRARALCKWFITYRSLIVISVLALILTTIAYRGYLLGFTDRYVDHRWLGKRWGMAARGIDSLKFLSFYTLNLMLSPLGLLAFLFGLWQLCRLAFIRASTAPIAVCAIGFFAALTIKQLTTPYLYYFGRYLVSELVPLAVICGTVAIHSLTRYIPRLRRLVLPAYCLTVFGLLYPALTARLAIREGRDFFHAMSCVNEATPGRSLLLTDQRGFSLMPLVTALRFTFNKPTFSIRATDFQSPGKLKDLITYFQSKGFNVHLLSASDSWGPEEGLVQVMKIPTIMRTVTSKRSAPTRINSVGTTIRLYSPQQPQSIPDICRRTQTYTK